MAGPEVWLEAEKRGLLTPDKQAILEEARKRGLMPAKVQASSGGPRVPQSGPIGPDGQEIDLSAPENAEYAAKLQAEADTAKKAKEAKLANRGILERVGDTAAFAGSIIPRTLTKGQYGLGDSLSALLPPSVSKLAGNVGKAVSGAERDFVEANQGPLQIAADVGAATAGIPMLNTMGAPLKGVGAALQAARASPRATVAGAIRGTGAGGLANAIPAPQPKAVPLSRIPANQSNLPQNIQTIPERLQDIEAFRELGMKPFAPATGSKGTARAGRTVEELPLVGGTVKSPKTDIEIGLRDTQASLGSQLGSRGSEEQTGHMVQSALERYRGSGLDELDPSTVKAQGVEPYQPQKRAQVLTEHQAKNMQAAAPVRAAGQGGTAQTSRGATVAAAKPLEQIGKRRTNVEDLSDSQLANLARTPTRDTSFATRGEALYESAWRKIPEIMRKDESANSNQTGWKNLQNTLREIEGETNNQIAGQRTLSGGLAERIMKPRSHTNIPELRSIRTELGRSLGNFGQFDIGLDRTQLKRLYAATSRDMEAGLADLANRAWTRTQSKGKDFVRPEIAKKADAALYEFRRADRYFRQGMARMDSFMSVMGAKTPNEAARKITQALKEKTANPQMLRQLKGSLRPEELNALRGYVIENLGRGRAGAKEAETVFNVNNWATDFNAMMEHPGGREFMSDLPEGVAKRLSNMARVVNRMKYYESTKNQSGTAYTAMSHPLAPAMAQAGATGALLFAPKLLFAAGVFFGGSGALGKLLTSKAYLAWQEGLMKAQLKAGNTAASNARILAQYVRRLPALAKMQKDPDLQKAITGIGVIAQQQLQGQEREKQKAQALPAPRQFSIP